MSRPCFVLFGDSITQCAFADNGWAASLADAYSTRVDVLNRGFSGYNSRWAKLIAKEVFGTELTSNAAQLATVFFGANDAVREEYGKQQYVPVDEYKENIKYIIQTARSRDNYDGSGTIVFLVTPPPVNQEAWRKRCEEKYANDDSIVIPKESNRGNDILVHYVQALLDIGKEMDVPVIDIFHGMQEADTDDADDNEGANDEKNPSKKRKLATSEGKSYYKYLSDGLHLSEEGNQFVFKQIMKMIEKPENARFLGVDKFRPQFVHHSEIDYKNPEKSLNQTIVGSWIKE